jgi:hypothetical protein
MADPITEYKGAVHGGFVISMSEYSFHMKLDTGLVCLKNNLEACQKIIKRLLWNNFLLFVFFCSLKIAVSQPFVYMNFWNIVANEGFLYSFIIFSDLFYE